MRWHGPEELRPLLQPIGDFVPHPENPRRGNTEEIAASLERFGQLKPIVSFENTIYAGNHVWRAAMSVGWTEIAAVVEPALTEPEAHAYLIADNRLTDVAGYDPALLTASLERLRKLSGGLTGTGYDKAQLGMQLAALKQAAVTESDWHPTYAAATHQCPRCGKTWEGDPRP